MARTFNISVIVADIARTCNIPAFTSSTNVTLGQTTAWLEQSARSLSALYKQKLGEDRDYFVTQNVTTTSGFNLVSLPLNSEEIEAVIWQKSPSDFRLLESGTIDDLEDSGDPVNDWSCTQPVYRFQGNALQFIPTPQSTETLTIYYGSDLDISGDATFQARTDADRWLTLDVACKVLSAKQRDFSLLRDEKLLLESNLFQRERDWSSSSIRDVRARNVRRAYRNWSY